MTLARDPKQLFIYVIGWSSPGLSSCSLSSQGSDQSSFPTTIPTATTPTTPPTSTSTITTTTTTTTSTTTKTKRRRTTSTSTTTTTTTRVRLEGFWNLQGVQEGHLGVSRAPWGSFWELWGSGDPGEGHLG